MKRNLIHALAAGIILSAGSEVRAEDAALGSLRTAYKAAVERATAPVKQTYVEALKRLLNDKMAKNDVLGVQEVNRELTLVRTGAIEASASAGAEMAKGGGAGDGIKAVIAANSPEGFRIGTVKKGDVITLTYVGGIWKAYGGIASTNPDEATPGINEEDKDRSRLVIARAPNKGLPGDVIAMVPGGTVGKPFSFTFPTSRDDVILRINANSDNKKNPGSVTYTFSIKPAE